MIKKFPGLEKKFITARTRVKREKIRSTDFFTKNKTALQAEPSGNFEKFARKCAGFPDYLAGAANSFFTEGGSGRKNFHPQTPVGKRIAIGGAWFNLCGVVLGYR